MFFLLHNTKTLSLNLEEYNKLEVPRQRYELNNIDQVLQKIAHEYHVCDGFSVLDYSGDEESLEALERGP